MEKEAVNLAEQVKILDELYAAGCDVDNQISLIVEIANKILTGDLIC
ncbi:hypothetical protein [Hafnia sp.]